MIAIPVKTNSLESAIAPLFSNAKWFALIDKNGNTAFWNNVFQNSHEIVQYFKANKVDRVVFQRIGGDSCQLLHGAAITCYHSGYGHILLNEVLKYLQDDALIRVTADNMAEFIEQPHLHSQEEHEDLRHCNHHAHHNEH